MMCPTAHLPFGFRFQCLRFREECGTAALGCAKALHRPFGTKLKARSETNVSSKTWGREHAAAVCSVLKFSKREQERFGLPPELRVASAQPRAAVPNFFYESNMA